MNTSTIPVPGVFHFLQHHTVLPQDWHTLCQAITTAYLKMQEHPDSLSLATAPVICEHTGNRPLRDDDSVIGLGVISFNGERAAYLAGDSFYCTDVKYPMLPSDAIHGGIPINGW
ncbi:hypothetical protein [Serratia fonticola]|uniref:hypothetical protein n=1 Tax=Serratia fonticola TaxID=47917 RepID=UPI0021791188|nr:hypothetical protein [Serratia fonticola]CAI0978275.1 Uncharacterised protein [Serratia fonticola]